MEAVLLTVQNFIDKRQDKYIQRLREFVAIQSISEDLDHRLDVLKALRWCGLRLEGLKLKVKYRVVGKENVYEGDQLPLHSNELCNIPLLLTAMYGEDKTKSTVLIYGHVDVKKIDKDENWTHDPFDLQVVGDYMWGRGVTDDKGPVLGWINAIEAYTKCNMELPVNIRIILDGTAETGSEGVRELLHEMKKDFLKNVRYCAISDSQWLGQNKPCLTYGMRGAIYFYMHISGAHKHLHSGSHGGVIQEPLEDLTALLSSLVDCNGRICVPGVYNCVLDISQDELCRFKALDFDVCKYKAFVTTPGIHSDCKVDVLKRMWCQPSISVHGIENSFDQIGAPTTIPKKVTGKFSMRTVANQHPRVMADLVRHYLQSLHCKRGSRNILEIQVFMDGQPFFADVNCPNFLAARAAVTQSWEMEPDLIRDGSTMSMAVILEETLGKDVVLIPMGQNEDFEHECNERLSIRNMMMTTKVFVSYLAHLAKLQGEDSDCEDERQEGRNVWRKSFW